MMHYMCNVIARLVLIKIYNGYKENTQTEKASFCITVEPRYKEVGYNKTLL